MEDNIHSEGLWHTTIIKTIFPFLSVCRKPNDETGNRADIFVLRFLQPQIYLVPFSGILEVIDAGKLQRDVWEKKAWPC